MSSVSQQALSSPIASELLVGALPVVPMESLSSPVANERESQPQTRPVPGQDAHTIMSDQCVEASPLHSDPEDTSLLCSSPSLQDSGRPAMATFSPPAGPESSLSQTSAPQPPVEPQIQYQVPHQLQVSQALFAQNQVQIQSSVSQALPQVQVHVQPELQVQAQTQVHVQPPVSQPQPSAHSSPSSLLVSVSVPQQQPDPTAAGVSMGGDDSAVQQHTQNSECLCCRHSLTLH